MTPFGAKQILSSGRFLTLSAFQFSRLKNEHKRNLCSFAEDER